MPFNTDMIRSLFPRRPGKVGVSCLIKSGNLTHKKPPVHSMDHCRSVCCIPEQAVTAALRAHSSKKGRFIIYYHFATPSGDEDNPVLDMCRKYEFEINSDGTLQFVKERVVTEMKTQKAAWAKHPSYIRRLMPIGEPAVRMAVVVSDPLVDEEEEWLEGEEEWGRKLKENSVVKKGGEGKEEGRMEHEEREEKVGKMEQEGKEENDELKDEKDEKKELKERKERKEREGDEEGEEDEEDEEEEEDEEDELEEPRREEEEQTYRTHRLVRAHRFALYGVGNHISMVSPVSAVSGDGTWRLLVNDPLKANTSTHVLFISLPELVCQMIACGVQPKDVPASLIQGGHGCVGLRFEPVAWSGPEWLRSPNGEGPPSNIENEGWWYSWRPRMEVWVC